MTKICLAKALECVIHACMAVRFNETASVMDSILARPLAIIVAPNTPPVLLHGCGLITETVDSTSGHTALSYQSINVRISSCV